MRGVYEKVKGSNDWYISYFDGNGRHHRQHVGRHSAAVEAYVNKKREIREGKFIAPATPKNATTFEELFNMRMADLERSLSRKTFLHLKSNFNSARLADLKNMMVRNISKHDIEEVLRGLYKDRCSGLTIRNYRALISAVFAYGIENDYLDRNPVKKIKQKLAKDQDRVRFLSKDEEEAIRQQIRSLFPEREPELDLMLQSGLRSGEAYGLEWDRIDLERGVISVQPHGKTGWRDVPVNSACRKALEKLHEQSEGSEFVIPRGGKTQNYALSAWFATAVEKAGVIHATPHTLRHTFASRLIMAGVDLCTVQKFMGHKKISMTARYAHLSPEHGQAAIERLVTFGAPAPAAAQAKPPVRAAKPAIMARPRAAKARIAS